MIRVSPAALQEIRRLLEAQNHQDMGLRVGVKGGGCSGLTYALNFEKEPANHDRVFEIEGIKFFCDPKSYLYLNGLELNFSDNLIGGGFQFSNPNASRTCCCGVSFNV